MTGKEYEPCKREGEEHAKEKTREKERTKKGIKTEGERERARETELYPYSRLPSAKVILPSGYLPRQPGWPTQST